MVGIPCPQVSGGERSRRNLGASMSRFFVREKFTVDSPRKSRHVKACMQQLFQKTGVRTLLSMVVSVEAVLLSTFVLIVSGPRIIRR